LYETPISLKKEQVIKAKNDENSTKLLDNFTDDVNIIQNMWNDLGVNNDFKNVFMNIAANLDSSICKEFFEFEISSLSKYANNLTVKFIFHYNFL